MSFPLTGNERVRDAVLASINENRLPHAILIEGDKGTGKRTLAHFLANVSVCSGENAPCNSCRGCHLAKTGNHPDITLTAPEDGKKNITVAQIRTLRNEAYIKPHMAVCRVFIIDKADSMNEQAQNALLKVLEEPPGNVIFILIAETAVSLLDTVISRCTVLSLVPPEIQVAAEYIKTNTDYANESITAALEETGGNIGAALDILSGGGTKAQKAAADFVKQLLSGNGAEMLKITAVFEKSRVEADAFFKELKLETAAEVKKKRASTRTARALVNFYNSLPDFEEALLTNINLSLLFCALTAKAMEINK